jgi:hypothetical protein
MGGRTAPLRLPRSLAIDTEQRRAFRNPVSAGVRVQHTPRSTVKDLLGGVMRRGGIVRTGLFFLISLVLRLMVELRRGPLALPPVAALASNFRHVRAISAHGLAAFATDVGHVLAILAHRGAAPATDFRHVRAIAADRFASFAANAGHVLPILAHRLAALANRLTCLIGSKLMRSALHVGCLSPLACDLALPLLIHRCEATPRFL